MTQNENKNIIKYNTYKYKKKCNILREICLRFICA